MAQQTIFLLIIVAAILSCSNPKPATPVQTEKAPVCDSGLMKSSRYVLGETEAIPTIKGLPEVFLIAVDTQNKATNFISSMEKYARERSKSFDGSNYWFDEDERLTDKQKRDIINEKRAKYAIEADSFHAMNNQGQTQIWLINNSTDTIALQMNDWTAIATLQAIAKDGKWYPIEYGFYNSCGNSYHYKYLPPKTANSFVKHLPDSGDYATKLRYKFLGKDRFYYSNEFDGRINYCEFVEDTTQEDAAWHFQLKYFGSSVEPFTYFLPSPIEKMGVRIPKMVLWVIRT